MAGDMGNEFPADVMAVAQGIADDLPRHVLTVNRSFAARVIARALMAERERAVAACEAQKASFASEEYATPQPLGGLMERFACDRCIEAIRNPAQSKPEGEAA